MTVSFPRLLYCLVPRKRIMWSWIEGSSGSISTIIPSPFRQSERRIDLLIEWPSVSDEHERRVSLLDPMDC